MRPITTIEAMIASPITAFIIITVCIKVFKIQVYGRSNELIPIHKTQGVQPKTQRQGGSNYTLYLPHGNKQDLKKKNKKKINLFS